MRSCDRPKADLKVALCLPVLVICAIAGVVEAQSTDPSVLYQQALRREAVLRQELDVARPGAPAGLLLERIRILVGSFEDLARLFTAGDHTDDSLWHGGALAADTFARFSEPADRIAAVRLLRSLSTRFPSGALARQASARLKILEGPKTTTLATVAGRGLSPGAAATPGSKDQPQPDAAAIPKNRPDSSVMLKEIRREVLSDTVRITLELDREAAFRDERIDGPPRVFIDLQNTRAADALRDATIPFIDGIVKQVRVGRQLNARTRVVLDLGAAGPHSVYALYNPYRVVIDFERTLPALLTSRTPSSVTVAAAAPVVVPSQTSAGAQKPTQRTASLPDAFAGRGTGPAANASSAKAGPVKPGTSAGVAPAARPENGNGGFSLARQLGLGVARIVIDPGHGGHDPGARVNGLAEASLVLDVALRLEELLKKKNIEVLLTRRTDTYVSLDERTAIANRSAADLFLSIHVNASTAETARGVETYFLNFATNPEAEAIAARENAGSARSMRHLPDIVQAIALNNKIDESRDFAGILQSTLFAQLRKTNKNLKNLGIKQAPFMVLVGATMPSVLAEISFMTNSGEASLLKTERYRQQIAEALSAGVMRYQESLKKGAVRTE